MCKRVLVVIEENTPWSRWVVQKIPMLRVLISAERDPPALLLTMQSVEIRHEVTGTHAQGYGGITRLP